MTSLAEAQVSSASLRVQVQVCSQTLLQAHIVDAYVHQRDVALLESKKMAIVTDNLL